MKHLEVINISFIRQSNLFLYRRDSACLAQLLVRRHYFSAWMLPLDRWMLASHLTLLVRTAADCVAEPFHTKEPLKGHKTDNFSKTWFDSKCSHMTACPEGTPCFLGTLKTLLKEPLANGLWNAQASSGIPGQVGHKSQAATKAHVCASTTLRYTPTLSQSSNLQIIVYIVYIFAIIAYIFNDDHQTGCRRLKWSVQKCVYPIAHIKQTHTTTLMAE